LVHLAQIFPGFEAKSEITAVAQQKKAACDETLDFIMHRYGLDKYGLDKFESVLKPKIAKTVARTCLPRNRPWPRLFRCEKKGDRFQSG
jgi:hypothetical protein